MSVCRYDLFVVVSKVCVVSGLRCCDGRCGGAVRCDVEVGFDLLF
jgi:hypothetical protein